MGTIGSCIQEVENVRFEPFPGRPIKTAKSIRIDRSVFSVSERNPSIIYTTDHISSKIYLVGTTSDSSPLKALEKLGYINKEQRMKHGERARISNEMAIKAMAVYEIIPKIKDIGIKLTKSQKKTLDRQIKTIDLDLLNNWMRKKIEKIIVDTK